MLRPKHLGLATHRHLARLPKPTLSTSIRNCYESVLSVNRHAPDLPQCLIPISPSLQRSTNLPNANPNSPPFPAIRFAGCTPKPTFRSPTRQSSLVFPASRPTPAAFTPPCIVADSGPCANSPASAPPRTLISASATCSRKVRPASPPLSICPR